MKIILVQLSQNIAFRQPNIKIAKQLKYVTQFWKTNHKDTHEIIVFYGLVHEFFPSVIH